MSRLIVFALVSLLTLTGTSRAADFVVRPQSDANVTFVSKTTTEKFEGRTREVWGRASFDPAGIGDSVRVHLEVDLASLKTGSGQRDKLMRETCLETDKYPRATFDGVTVNGLAPGLEPNTRVPIEVEGTLTLHGVSRRLRTTIHVTYLPQSAGESIKFETRFPVVLADYNIAVPNVLALKLAGTQEVHVIGTAVAPREERPVVATMKPGR
jgi:polyisoprenoid-binding protein YceI